MSRVQKYNIVQISSVHPSFDTRIFHKICKSLVSEGYNVDLIIQHGQDEIVEGINIKALPIAKKKSDRLFKIIPDLFKKCIKYPSNTIFHFHDPELLPLGLFLKTVGYKVIYDVHEDVPEDIKSKKWIPAPLRSLLINMVTSLESIGNRFFDDVIVVTQAIYDRFRSDTTHLIQNFPILKSDEGDTKTPTNPNRNCVFYLGDITLIRGLKEEIQAVDIVNQTHDVNFILGGKFSPPSLEKTLKSEPGWKYVEFVGWVSKSDFNVYVNKSFAGLVTFHPEPNHIKAQPNKLFEYMYAGLPVVASSFPLWRNIVEENNCGLLVDPQNPQSIADAITYLYEHPVEAKKMGENGRKAVVEKYNWTTEEKKLLALYSNLMDT